MKEDVTNIIEPVLLTKLHIQQIGNAKLSDLKPCLDLIAVTWRLNLSDIDDFRVATKILEECVYKN